MTSAILKFATPQNNPALHTWAMMVDGNQHRSDLCLNHLGFADDHLISEALLPQIRSIACMIAASRATFSQRSPAIFTEEADWFAARILVLQVRFFHLDVSLMPMLRLANRRAAAFAKKHQLPFTAAAAKPSLHSTRPHNMLKMELPFATPDAPQNFIANSVFLRDLIAKTMPSMT